MMTTEDRAALRALLSDALRFCAWAAGEGIAIAAGEPAKDPDDILMAWSEATDDDDWDTLPERITERLFAEVERADPAQALRHHEW